MIKLCGVVLILDALLSLVLPEDKFWAWQLGRIIRLGIGIYLFRG